MEEAKKKKDAYEVGCCLIAELNGCGRFVEGR